MEVHIARILIHGVHASTQHTVYAGIYLLSVVCVPMRLPRPGAFAIRYDEYINILMILIYN